MKTMYRWAEVEVVGVECQVLQDVLQMVALLLQGVQACLCPLLLPPKVKECHSPGEGHNDFHHCHLGSMVTLIGR